LNNIALTGLLLLLALGGCLPGHTADGSSSSPNLFADDATGAASTTNGKDPVVTRSRPVVPLFDLLNTDEFTFNLFPPDAVFDAKVEQRSIGGAGSAIVEGRLQGIPGSHFTLAMKDRVVSGNINLPDGRSFQIRYTPDGGHVAQQVDPSRYPRDAAPLVPPTPPQAP
jgi:hypothetical protein